MELKTCPGCDFTGEMRKYVSFHHHATLDKAREKDPYLPKFNFHMGLECPRCGRWMGNLKQDDSISHQRWYAENQS